MVKSKLVDGATLATMLITAFLFLIAAFEKGLTHELLLEAAVFLVSVKLVLASYKHDLDSRAMQAKLNSIEAKLDATLASKRPGVS